MEGTSQTGLFARPGFAHFGLTALDPITPLPPLCHVEAPKVSGLRARVRQECPRRPGVYGMVDAKGELLYVGKAKSLRARLLSYFRPRSREPKAGRILARTAAVVWEYCPSEFAALHRELELIRRWRPRFNVQGQPRGRRCTCVCLGRRPAPYVFLSRRPPANTLAAFGPVPAGRTAREAVRRLNDLFRLRDCSQAQPLIFAEETELFPVLRAAGCLRHEINTCLGPCTGACTRTAYLDEVAAARAFLAGTDRSLLDRLERDMQAASAALAFERAAALRDQWEALRWLCNQLDRLRQAREESSFVYPVDGEDGRDLWYLIHGGRTVAVTPAPRDNASRQTAAAAVAAVYPQRVCPAALLTVAEMDGLFLVASWFRRYPEERQRVLAPAEALGHCSSS